MSNTHPLRVVTQAEPGAPEVIWRFVENAIPPFDADCFDTDNLVSRHLIDGVADAGRGNTVFFTLDHQPLVLRHYYRGGLVRYISRSHYIFTGVHRTRALREFDMLLHLHDSALPAPLPYACRVHRQGFVYQASLITHRLAGRTLAQRLVADGYLSANKTRNNQLWQQIGDVIAQFHRAGVYHADLNAHNIMIDDEAKVSLLDFDRGALKTLPENPVAKGWCLQNMLRLERSIDKIARRAQFAASSPDSAAAASLKAGFSLCMTSWRTALQSI